ncbi:MAG: NUDIX domain-containing protein [Haloarculaceae archaeon]
MRGLEGVARHRFIRWDGTSPARDLKPAAAGPALAGLDPPRYPSSPLFVRTMPVASPRPAVNNRPLATIAVVLPIGEVVVLEWTHSPYEGHWALPGCGFVDPHEAAREACVRETREEVGLDVDPVAFVGLFDDPDRDERWTVTAAHLCRPRTPVQSPSTSAAARRVRTVDPAALPPVGVDHAAILEAALSPWPGP